MSEFTVHRDHRLSMLLELSAHILKTGNARGFIQKHSEFITAVVPSDFIYLFDELVGQDHDIEVIKGLSNKILNIFHKTIATFERIQPEPDTFISILELNNREMEQLLNRIRPGYKSFLGNPGDAEIRKQLILDFEELERFTGYYVIKENVLFPVVEKYLPEHRCFQIMWSIHDDIRRNLKLILEILKVKIIDLKIFNRCVGDLYFNMLTTKFREEYILFPHILSTLSEHELEIMNQQAAGLGFPYIKPRHTGSSVPRSSPEPELIDLASGALSVEQIKLIFNHLPVDITYVDEHDKVRYFSSSKERAFPRTRAIIGRDVHNCHPPESVHIVKKIIRSFRNGEKNQALFWIHMKGEYILIQYFAVRNETNDYRGVVEVTQEISDIKKIKGEKRLLDW